VQKGIGIFTKSVKFADFPSAETANSRFGLPPLLAQASSRPRRPHTFAAGTLAKKRPASSK